MTAAIILISFVVLRVTEREILKQRTETGEAVFSMIASSLSHLKDKILKTAMPTQTYNHL